jgi:5'-phosphate synthase pdxT subunit
MNSRENLVKMIGVLDLQGGVIEHLSHLKSLGVNGRRVKKPQDIAGLSGLIIPGGESTCISKLINIFGLHKAITEEFNCGMKIWGTCAGAILLAKNIAGEAPHLALMDIEIKRNGFVNWTVLACMP